MKITETLQKYFDSKEAWDKNTFWFTDSEKNSFDIYHKWIGTEPTNPPTIEKQFMFESAKQIEVAWINLMTDAELLLPSEEIAKLGGMKDGQLYLSGTRSGVPISGKPDGVHTSGAPLEIKTYYDKFKFVKNGKEAGWHEHELLANKPDSQYCKQLAMQMDFMDQDTGYLLFVDRGTGAIYQFRMTRKGTIYECGDTVFDLNEVYQRWAKIYQDHILPKKEPVSDFRYKIPVTEINWRTLSKSDITKARNGKKVIGDGWQVAYSEFKDLIIEREGSSLGYSMTEIEIIKQATSGYSTWK